MIGFISSQTLFYFTLAFVFFLPGYFLLLAIFGKNKILSSLERFVISCGLSMVSVDFIFFILARLNISLNRLSVFTGLIIIILAQLIIYKLRTVAMEHNDRGGLNILARLFRPLIRTNDDDKKESELFNFTKKEFILILLLIFLTIFIKTAYLASSVLPTATDMGHHMYWSKWIVGSGKLPVYSDVSDPAMFIIGEHIPFAVLNIFSGADFLSAFPTVLLFLVNLLGILAVFILVLRIFKNRKIAILSLLFLGVLYAISSPQAKYVSGGVVGNVFGNFLLPLAFYFYYRAFEFLEDSNNVKIPRQTRNDKNSKNFLALAVFVTFGLLYTHHLTAFIFIFIFLIMVILMLVVNYRELENLWPKVRQVIFSWQAVSALVLGIIFFFWVFTPTYVSGSAVDTAVGAPSKVTRVGLSIKNLRDAVGEARFALGIFGLFVLVFTYKRRNIGYALLTSWFVMIFIMSAWPKLLFVDIPSNRIGNYLTYPIAVLSALAFHWIFKRNETNWIIKSAFGVILTFVLVGGISDSASAFKTKINFSELAQTFSVSGYLATETNFNDKIVKDHNYIEADAWMKLFFMRGYRYPESRSYFKRYEDGTRDNCTLVMISNPGSAEAQKCFQESGTNFVIVNPLFDGGQFRKLDSFSQVYFSDDIAVFYRK